jgi:hypothetical protein
MARTRTTTEAVDFADGGVTDIGDISLDDGVEDYSKFRVMTDNQVEVITEREFKETQEVMQFMQDLLVIEIHRSSDQNAPTHALVGVNGEQVWLPRGRKLRVPRYFVERLARSRPRDYKTEDNPDPRADIAKRTTRQTGMDYPFNVLQDPNPRGRVWLERVIKESR